MAGSTTPMDLRRLAGEVSAQHGIRIDPDDPIMAVVTLNRLVFEQAVAQVLDRVQSSVRDFESATEKVQVRAGGVLAQEVRDCAAILREEIANAAGNIAPEATKVRGRNTSTGSVSNSAWVVAGLGLALVLLALGVWLGTRLR
jgi:CHASE3 domain sensor protein